MAKARNTPSQDPEDQPLQKIVQQPVAQFDHTSKSYVELLGSLKSRIQRARTKALLSVKRDLTAVYWVFGHQIVEAQNREGWGTSMIDRLALDLQSALPTRSGLSPAICGACERSILRIQHLK